MFLPTDTSPISAERSEIQALELSLQAIERLLGRCDITLFGSRARRDHQPDSDWDFLVTPHRQPGFSSWDQLDDLIETDIRNHGGPHIRLNIQVIPPDRLEDAFFEFPFMRGVDADGVNAKTLLRHAVRQTPDDHQSALPTLRS